MNTITIISLLLIMVMVFSQVAMVSAIEEPNLRELDNEEIYQMYKDFLNNSTRVLSIEDKETIDEFVEYAANNGIIPNTPEARLNMAITIKRGTYQDVADTGRLFGWDTAAECREHSLQDNPSNKFYLSGSGVSNQVKESIEESNLLNKFKTYVTGKQLGQYTTSGSEILNSTKDLFLAFNKVSYVVSGTKNSSGKWTVTIKYSDTYNFENWSTAAREEGYTDLVTKLNNMASGAQSRGVIVPYSIQITTVETFYE